MFPFLFFVVGDNLISLLLYGKDKFDNTKNRKILTSMIGFTRDSPRFEEQLW